jgi:hypothetical protein
VREEDEAQWEEEMALGDEEHASLLALYTTTH